MTSTVLAVAMMWGGILEDERSGLWDYRKTVVGVSRCEVEPDGTVLWKSKVH